MAKLQCNKCGGPMRQTTEGVVSYGGPSRLVKLVCDKCDIWRLENREDIEKELAQQQSGGKKWWQFWK